MAVAREVRAGTVLAEDGQPLAEVGYVLEGTLGMVKLLPDGRQHIIGLLVPNDLFGRVFDGPPNFRIVALSDARLLTFPVPAFQALLEREPELERLFLIHVLDELDAAREWLLLMNGLKVIQRVASFLIILSRRSPAAGVVEVVMPLSRKDLAHYLGARPESLSRAFGALARMRVIEAVDAGTGRYRILDPKRLVQISGQDLVLG
ncbi:Crp/Fnr family transcriptional regulator [Cereibacter sphaeroides]|uniref:Crp/Fnr family transcriptional regulator n=1 Tax=Rhodobacterales TaxID=204455 RepID=UPI001E51102F|nr:MULTISPECIES: Crp/Fnr family transcriptional regulator [Paracoccaceae]MCE6951330.1 Crp/Fnr family transcriptional regulator [Cereibacter sphaeroides]MCE6960655.1 Crp/Fnr family transcriptional regulator [Cereibacter sphaeroides]MCE6970078.1 Crp/Fnr family transcriptional regulator [Cereibacter sphaeroides]MCE6973243.1 Crp/Fnr family transcriptional regulator [Cereibacter sphaeroides]